MMMHKSPAMKVVCMVTWVVTALVAVAVGAAPMGWNFMAGWLMNMPWLHYVILAAGLVSLASFVMHMTCKECH